MFFGKSPTNCWHVYIYFSFQQPFKQTFESEAKIIMDKKNSNLTSPTFRIVFFLAKPHGTTRERSRYNLRKAGKSAELCFKKDGPSAKNGTRKSKDFSKKRTVFHCLWALCHDVILSKLNKLYMS